MKKLKLMITSLSLVATLALAVPAVAYADGGPQGGSNSTTPRPPPPPPPEVLALIEFLVSLLS